MTANHTELEKSAKAHVAALLEGHAAAISQRWSELASGILPVRPGLEPVTDGSTVARTSLLLALIQCLRDPADAGLQHLLERQVSRWHDAGLVGAETRPYFDWLRTAALDILSADADLGPEAEELPACLADELAELRLQVAEIETRRLREAHRELRGQLEALFEHASDPVVMAEAAQGDIESANAAASRITGYPTGRLRTMTLSELCPDLSGANLQAFFAQVIDDGSAARQGITLTRHNQEPLACTLRGALVKHDGAALVMCTLQDVGAETTPERGASEIEARAGEVEHLKSFFENVISALPIRLLVLDSDLSIVHTNPAYYVQRGLSREEVLGRHIDDVFPHDLLETAGLRAALMSVIDTGERVRWSGYRQATGRHGERVLNIRLDPCEGPDGSRSVLVSLEDITERHRQLYERTILQQISRALLGELDLPRLLHAILTGMTAGGVVGLGFNRAILMLVDEEAGVLRAEMAVGPETREQAISIWQEVSHEHRTLADFLSDYDRLPVAEEPALRDLVENLVVPLDDVDYLPMAAITSRQTAHVADAELDERVRPELRAMLETDEFVVAPLVAREKVMGVAIADNRFSQQPIDQAAVQLLTTLADHAALAVDTARTYRRAREDAIRLDQALSDLQAAQDEALRSAKLAAVGEVTAIVAHEIRSPLSTIGGFARSIAREPERVSRIAGNAQIIVEEVDRLEGILGELLDFSKPSEPDLSLIDLGPVIESVAHLARQSDQSDGVEVIVELSPDLPAVLADEKQVRQITTNLIMNALQAMPQGGVLTITVCAGDRVDVLVQDTGEGMAKKRLERIFDAFYTSKPTGTGLGLALCKKLATQHGAEMRVESEEGQGATFVVSFPIPDDDKARTSEA